MLNEPFGILDNIPLIWCFASFETCQSGVLEIVTQKRGLTDAPRVPSVLSLLYGTSAPLVHFHTNHSQPLSRICIPYLRLGTGTKLCWSLEGEGRRNERWKSEEGARVIACSPDTWSLSGEELRGRRGYVINLSSALMFQNKDEHLALIFVACSADGLLR